MMTAENSDLALYKFTAFRKLKCPPSQGCPVASKAPVGVVGRGPQVPADVHVVLRAGWGPWAPVLWGRLQGHVLLQCLLLHPAFPLLFALRSCGAQGGLAPTWPDPRPPSWHADPWFGRRQSRVVPVWRAGWVPAAGALGAGTLWRPRLASPPEGMGRCWAEVDLGPRPWADGQGLLQRCVIPVEMQLSPRVLCTYRRALSEDGSSQKREGKERLRGVG